MNIIEHGPEIPDPSQLTIFDMEAKPAETVQNSTDSATLYLSSEPLIRSPTDLAELIPLENGKKFELNHSQRTLASSLYDKSRELAKKAKDNQIELIESEEETTDLAR